MNIKYHEYGKGNEYGADHTLTDNWNPDKDYKNEYNKTDLFDWDRNGFEKYTNIINREHFRAV